MPHKLIHLKLIHRIHSSHPIQFIHSGEKEWPAGVKNAEDLTKINNPKSVPYATMGGAIPWRFYCKEYGGRQKLLDAIYAAWTEGTSSAKVK